MKREQALEPPVRLQTHLEEYLVGEKVILQGTSTYLGQGEAHINFFGQTENGGAVIRVGREDTPDNQGFTNERTQLLFLESQGIDFAPRSLFYDSDKEVHVISFFDAQDTSTLELDENQQKQLIGRLTEIESLKYSDYTEFCANHGLEALPLDPMTARIERNIDKRITVIEQLLPTLPVDITGYLAWCKDKYKCFAELAAQLPTSTRYLHGDLRWNNGTSNLMVDRAGNIKMIDWEKSRFAHDSLLELGDIIASLPQIKSRKTLVDTLTKSYETATKLNLSKAEIQDRLKISTWFAAIGTPLWALERYAVMSNAGRGNPEPYLEKAKQRIQEGEDYMAEDFEL